MSGTEWVEVAADIKLKEILERYSTTARARGGAACFILEGHGATGIDRRCAARAVGDASSGRTATGTGINVFRIACGRIAEAWSEVDAVSRTRQLTGAPR